MRPMPEPGVVELGEWAHVRWNGRQHRVVAVEPGHESAKPVRFACGSRTETFRVWHGAPEPHLPKCAKCANTTIEEE